ncbi:MAG: amidohydrolase [Chloroflexi bacterium]|nr:amidohydrolase [Chloroflexota bacterium]
MLRHARLARARRRARRGRALARAYARTRRLRGGGLGTVGEHAGARLLGAARLRDARRADHAQAVGRAEEGATVIWDVHCHFPRDWQNPEGEDHAQQIDARADALGAAGVTRASVLCGGRNIPGPSHDESLQYLARHEDLMVPVASLPMEETPEGEVERLHEIGYRGLKIIGSPLPIDDPSYFHVYAAAEERRMPILFHLGVIGGGVDYARTHPRRDPEAAAAFRRWQEFRRRGGPRNVSAARMRPFQLDTIANNFPDLPLIGAHLGGTGNYEEASSVARWRHNVVFDLSGGETIERHAMERRLIGREIGVEKLVWGSDCGNEEIGQHVERFRWMFEALGLDDEERDRIWYRNAAELFGEATPALADEQPE